MGNEAPNLSMKLLGVDRFKEFQTLSPEQTAVLNQLLGEIGPEIGKGISPYPGEMIPGEDVLQSRAFEGIASLAGGTGTQSAIDLALGRSLSGEPAYRFKPDETLSTFFEQVEAPQRAGFERTLRGVQEQFAGLGQERGGGFIDASLGASREFEQGLGAQRATFLRGEMDAERASREAAAERQLPAVAAAGAEELRIPDVLMRAGTARRDISAEVASEGVFDWLVSQPASNPWLGYLNLALGIPTKGVVSK